MSHNSCTKFKYIAKLVHRIPLSLPQLKVKKIGRHVSQEIGFYCFHVPAGYNKEVNAINLKEMGVDTPLDVGHELVKIFRKKLKQEDVAEKLRDHVLKLQQSKGTGKGTSK